MVNKLDQRKKRNRRILLGTVTLILLLIAIPLTVLLSATTYGPTNELWTYVTEEDYSVDGQFTVFEPDDPNGTGIILYPGAYVEPLSYAYLADRLADQGYLVCILSVPFKLSIFASMRAKDFIQTRPDVAFWAVGGHSMGGVSASAFSAEHSDLVDALILLASYPAASTDLSGSALPVLSIYAELDGLTTLDDIEKSKALLPADTTFVQISGGNHAGFGMYGDQTKDNEPLISNLAQQDFIVQSIVDFLE